MLTQSLTLPSVYGAATPTENGATTKKGATTGATTSEKEPAKTTTKRTNLKTENDSSAGKFGELF